MSLQQVLGEREDILELLAEKSRRASELRRNAESLASLIRDRYSRDSDLSKLVKNILATYSLPPPPIRDPLVEAVRQIEEYSSRVEEYIGRMTRYASSLEQLERGLERLRNGISEVKKWHEALTSINEYLASSSLKLLRRAERLLKALPLEDPIKSLDEINALFADVERHNRTCMGVYESRVAELESLLEESNKLFKKAYSLSSSEEIIEIKAALNDLEKSVLELREEPEKMRDFRKVKERLSEVHRRLREFLTNTISDDEKVLLREYSRLRIALGGKSIRFSYLVEQLSRRSGLGIEETMLLIYKMCKKGLVKVQAKIF